MYVPRAHVDQHQFMHDIKRAAQSLAPEVVDIIPTLGNDWSGEPAVFFTVILSDAVARRPDKLLKVTDRVSDFMVQQVAPLEEWGVLPYFTFRTHAEQAKLERSWAGGFAAVALAIAVVGVAGVLAFSVSGRTREFGIRLAIGSQPRHLVMGVIVEGAAMGAAGVVTGAAGGFALASLASSYFQDVKMPGAVPVLASAVVLLAAAVIASALPAARAARVDVMQALRAD